MIPNQSLRIEIQSTCIKIFSSSATLLSTEALHEAEAKCVVTLADNTELSSDIETIKIVMPGL